MKQNIQKLKYLLLEAIMTLGKMEDALESSKAKADKEMELIETKDLSDINLSLDEMASIFCGRNPHSSKKRPYPCYKRPNSVPTPMKGEDLMELLITAQNEGIFGILGLSDEPDVIERSLINEAELLKEYVKAMNAENRQFYLLTSQKILLEKYEDNKIFNNPKESYDEFYKRFEQILLEEINKIGSVSKEFLYDLLPESVFLKAFRRYRIEIPTISYSYKVMKPTPGGSKYVTNIVLGRTRSELTRLLDQQSLSLK